MEKIEEKILELVKTHKLDRRRKYFEYGGFLVTNVNITIPCSGCTEYPEMTMPPENGSGCKECGYHGRVRCGVPNPVSVNNQMIAINHPTPNN